MRVGVSSEPDTRAHTHTHTHTQSCALRSPLMALGGPRQGRPSCCSFQLEPCQGAVPRSALQPNCANFIFMREKCKQYINTTLCCSQGGHFHLRRWKYVVQLSVRPVSGDVSKSLSLHVLGKKEEEGERLIFFCLCF